MEFLAGPKVDGCPFCTLPKQNDDSATLILARNPHSYIIINRYPYTSGHVMVIPFEHQADVAKLDDPTSCDLARSIKQAVNMVQKAYTPDGVNIGMNMGPAAGAGIPGHVHYHVIPRWVGDTNFMPVLGEVRVVNEKLEESYRRLSAALEPAP